MTTVNILPTGTQAARFFSTMATCRGDPMAGEMFAGEKGHTVVMTACKGLVNPTSQAAVDNALAPIVHDLAALLRPLTLIGRMASTRRAPFMTRLLLQSAGGHGSWVGEGRPIPVSLEGFAEDVTLVPMKVGSIRVLTTELARAAVPGSESLIAADAGSGQVVAMDTALVDPANGGDAQTPASITSGAPTFSSTGSTLAAIDHDLGLMIGSLVAAEMSLATATWIMSPITATGLALKRGADGAPAFPLVSSKGGFLLGLPVLTSTVCAASGSPGEHYIALVEQSEILVADDNGGSIELATSASLQMSDAPAGGATQQVSLWQSNLVGMKILRYINWRRRRTGAVAVLRDVMF